VFHLKNYGLPHNKTMESSSSSHSSKHPNCKLLEKENDNRDVLSLKVSIPSSRIHCISPRETRKADCC